jgi:hypothetical protein
MIRKRNFFLLLLLVAFLVGGIVLTVWRTWGLSPVLRYSDNMFNQSTATMTAEVMPTKDDKQGRLESLRLKIEALGSTVSLPPEDIIASAVSDATTTATSSTDKPDVPALHCSNYHAVNPPVLTGLLQYQEEGGQRLFSSQSLATVEASTTVDTTSVETVFTLPIRTSPLPVKNCLTVDIVAVTVRGTPIRNTDVSKYRSSGEASLLGYTIDGFALYGQTSNLETDECGGISVGGVYRYYLSAERNVILNCFAGIPVAL